MISVPDWIYFTYGFALKEFLRSKSLTAHSFQKLSAHMEQLGLPGEEPITPVAAAAVLCDTEVLALLQVLITNREQQEQGLPPKAQIPRSWYTGSPGFLGGDTHPGVVDNEKPQFSAKFRKQLQLLLKEKCQWLLLGFLFQPLQMNYTILCPTRRNLREIYWELLMKLSQSTISMFDTEGVVSNVSYFPSWELYVGVVIVWYQGKISSKCYPNVSLWASLVRYRHIWENHIPDEHQMNLIRHFSILIFSSQLCGQLGQVACLWCTYVSAKNMVLLLPIKSAWHLSSPKFGLSFWTFINGNKAVFLHRSSK